MILGFRANGFLILLGKHFWTKRLLIPETSRERHDKFDKFIDLILKFWL